jgi:molybdopterin biosynthesis enzyme MoaB
MKIPEIINVLIITLSDRAYSGEYSDLSGPRINERLSRLLLGRGLAGDCT